MSINEEIDRIENNIADAYDVAEEMGAEMPQSRNSANLASTISTVSAGTPLPDKEGHFGEFLKTDGTNIDWKEIAISDVARAGQRISFSNQEVPNFTAFGNPTIIDKVASNFSEDNYLVTHNFLNIDNIESFEVVTVFKYIDQMALYFGYKDILEANDKNAKGLRFVLTNEEHRRLFYRIEDETKELEIQLYGTTEIVSGTKYYSKLIYNCEEGYKVYLSTDGENWTLEAENSSTDLPLQTAGDFCIGETYTHNNYNYFEGEMYLDEWSATVNNSLVWTPYIRKDVIAADDFVETAGNIKNKNTSISATQNLNIWEGDYANSQAILTQAYCWKDTTSTVYENTIIPYGGTYTNPSLPLISDNYLYLPLGTALRVFDKSFCFIGALDLSAQRARTYAVSKDDTIYCIGMTPRPSPVYKIKNNIVTQCTTPLINSQQARTFFCFKNKVFLQVSQTYTFVSTDECTTWTNISGNVPASFNGVTVLDDVVFGYNSSGAWMSTDLETWTACDTKICYLTKTNNGYTGYISQNPRSNFYTSTDGITWTDTNIQVPQVYFGGFTYLDNTYFAYGATNNYDRYVAKSTDLTTWTNITESLDASVRAIKIVDNNLVITYNSSEVKTFTVVSLYKTRFTKEYVPTTSSSLYTYGSLKAIETISTVENNTITLSDSSVLNSYGDGTILSTVSETYPDTLAFITGKGLYKGSKAIVPESIQLFNYYTDSNNISTYGTLRDGTPITTDKIYADNSNGALYTYRQYVDGIAATPYNKGRSEKFVFGNNIFVSQTGDYTYDGMFFHDGNIERYGDGIVFDGTRFVIIRGDYGSPSYCYTSTDGINWTKGSNFTAYWPTGLAYKNGVYVCGSHTSAGGYLSYSTDLNNWTNINTSYGYCGLVIANSSLFVAAQEETNGVIQYSTNGSSWSVYSPSIGYLRSVFKCDDYIFVRGDNGIVYTKTGSWSSFTAVSNTTDIHKINNTYYAITSNGIYSSTSLFGTYTQITTKTIGVNLEYNGCLIGTSSIFDPSKGTQNLLELIPYASEEFVKKAYNIQTGSANGTISVNGTDIAVKGLGSAAYTASTAYATAAQGTKADTALQNTATGSNLTIASTYATTASNAYGNINIGATSKINTGSTQIQGCIAIGQSSQGSATNGIALGRLANVTGNQSTALGFNAKVTAKQAIQLGRGTNATDNTLQVGFWDDTREVELEYTLLDGNTGKIPTDRYITMVGADGTNAGTSGAVPAPSATDNTKFLRGDGTWQAVSSGGSSIQKICENNTALTSDGTVCTWIITHNLGTKDITINVYNLSTDNEPICDINHTSTNTVTVTFNSTTDIAADTYRAVIIG